MSVLDFDMLNDVSGPVVMMPAFGAAYSNTEIAAVANYVTARFGAANSHLTAGDVARFRQWSSQ